MTRKATDNQEYRQRLKNGIATKLAMGVACLVLSATVTHEAGATTENPPATTSVTDRIDAIRSTLQIDDTKASGPVRTKMQVTQWYNNWGNNWRNQRWFNSRRW